jgi:hypothetical protein
MTERKSLVSPGEMRGRLKSWAYVAMALADGLDGKPFDWGGGEFDAYRPKAKMLGCTLVTKTWMKKNGYRLRRGAKPVGTGYFKAPISNTGELYILECQAVKEEETGESAQMSFEEKSQ